jgi:glycosyltransferase involved in cell wall biosynthesis
MSTSSDRPTVPSICFVGLRNLPVLAREYGHHGVGGAELQQTLLAKALARRSAAVSMVVADYGQPDAATWDGVKTYKAYSADEGIPVLRFVYPRFTKLWAAMSRANADIYYTSCAGAQLGQVVLFARLHGARVIFRIASNSDCDPASLLIRYQRDKRLYRYGLRRADLVLAQTADQQRALEQNYTRESRVVAPLADCAAVRRNFADRDIGALWVGNIRSLKRPELLLEVARRLPHISFHMIGGPMPGAQELFDSLKTAASQLANLQFHGAVAYHEVASFYERARVLVGTSQIEGFPNTYLQAWAHGTPVIAFLDPEGLLAHNAQGRAVSNIEEMCAAIVTLSTDTSQWAAASLRSTQYIDSRFNETQMLAPYVEAIRDLSPGPRAAADGPAKTSLLKP